MAMMGFFSLPPRPASYPICTGASYSTGKRPRHEVDHSPQSRCLC